MRSSNISAVLILTAIAASAVYAQDKSPSVKLVKGPASINLDGNEGVLNLPKGYIFIDKATSEMLLKKHGEPVGDHLMGMVSEDKDDLQWMGILEYEPSGYIKDDEADHLDADGLLTSIKEGTEEANEERKKNGAAPMDVVGWFNPPQYDRNSHFLAWSIIGKDAEQKEPTVNFNALELGRYGYISCTVVGDKADAPLLQSKLGVLESSVKFVKGHDYASFREGDAVSKVTMAGLITGGAAAAAYGAAKVGLLGKIGVLLLGLKKGLIVILAAMAAGFRKLKERITAKKNQTPAAGAPPADTV